MSAVCYYRNMNISGITIFVTQDKKNWEPLAYLDVDDTQWRLVKTCEPIEDELESEFLTDLACGLDKDFYVWRSRVFVVYRVEVSFD